MQICKLETATYDKSRGLLQNWIGRCQNVYAWLSQPNTSAWHPNNFTEGFSVKNIVINQKRASPYFYIGGFVAVYPSKMAATVVGPRFIG